METWERQRQEIDSYNLFYSAIEHKHKKEGLINHGFRLIGPFVEIPDPWNNVNVEPDFVLFDGASLLLSEIKSGENINEPDIEQMKRYTELGREAVEDFLKDTPVAENNLDVTNVETIDYVIVYYADFIQKCRDEWPNCADALAKMETVTPVLTQIPGGKLKLESGSLSSDKLHNLLSDGIPLPTRTQKRVYLTENIEPECLAFSICYDIVLNNIGADRCELTVSEIRDYYGRRIPIADIEEVFEFLKAVNACREESNGTYVFTRNNISRIMRIESMISERPVAEYLDDDDEQSGLEDFL